MSEGKRQPGIERATLTLLAESDSPLGSPRLVFALRAAGIDVAEATAGRFLRSLDERGFTARIGRQGRVITEQGRQRLHQIQLSDRLDGQSSELVRILSESDATELVDILILRRAVEGEAARLAALRATEVEQRWLCEIAALHTQHVAAEREGKQDALNFHLAVAMAAHSPIVQATIELLIEPGNNPSMQVLDILTLEAGAQFGFANEHSQVAEAIQRRDPVSAEAAMRAHLDALTSLVEAFLARTS